MAWDSSDLGPRVTCERPCHLAHTGSQRSLPVLQVSGLWLFLGLNCQKAPFQGTHSSVTLKPSSTYGKTRHPETCLCVESVTPTPAQGLSHSLPGNCRGVSPLCIACTPADNMRPLVLSRRGRCLGNKRYMSRGNRRRLPSVDNCIPQLAASAARSKPGPD